MWALREIEYYYSVARKKLETLVKVDVIFYVFAFGAEVFKNRSILINIFFQAI